jgi:hypothetical protein
MYRDCSGIAAPTSVSIYITSASLTFDTMFVMVPDSGTGMDITPSCPSTLTYCNSGGTYYGYQKYSFSGVFTLPAPASDWIFAHTLCCRGNSITNLSGATGDNSYVYSTLDNLNTPFNNSALFATDPAMIMAMGTLNTINNGAYDPDGDSISISLVPALNDYANPCVYMIPFTAISPISSSTGIVFDSFIGDLTLTPSVSGEVDVIVFLVQEYRNGILIGSVMRDMSVGVSTSSNNLPSINYSYPYVATGCVGATLNLNITTSDIDITDSTFIDTVNVGLPSGSFTCSFTPGQNQSMQLQFTSDSTMISANPYLVKFVVRDNGCPYYGRQCYTYRIFVNNCNTLVWPGDANGDLTADVYDILPLGIGSGATGNIRAGASTNWIGQPCTPWAQNFLTGTNYMHADCNGDGVIDTSDLNSINLNYGLIHPMRLSHDAHQQSLGGIFIVASVDTVYPSSAFTVDVQVGSNSLPVDSMLGLAFRIYFDSQLVDSSLSSFQFSNSWLGTPGVNLMTLHKIFWSQGYMDVGASRSDHFNSSGYGSIGTFSIYVNANAGATRYCYFSVSGVQAITTSENISVLESLNDSVYLNAPSVGFAPEESVQVNIFPSPAKDELMISSSFEIVHMIITDMPGKQLRSQLIRKKEFEVDIHSLSPGIYFLQLRTAQGMVIKKFVKQ